MNTYERVAPTPIHLAEMKEQKHREIATRMGQIDV